MSEPHSKKRSKLDSVEAMQEVARKGLEPVAWVYEAESKLSEDQIRFFCMVMENPGGYFLVDDNYIVEQYLRVVHVCVELLCAISGRPAPSPLSPPTLKPARRYTVDTMVPKPTADMIVEAATRPLGTLYFTDGEANRKLESVQMLALIYTYRNPAQIVNSQDLAIKRKYLESIQVVMMLLRYVAKVVPPP